MVCNSVYSIRETDVELFTAYPEVGTHRIAPGSIAPIRRDFLALAVLRKRSVLQQLGTS